MKTEANVGSGVGLGVKTDMTNRYDPKRWAMQFGVDIAVAVSELPDRTSPDDWPEAMLVTASEISAIVEPRIFPELETAFESGADESESKVIAGIVAWLRRQAEAERFARDVARHPDVKQHRDSAFLAKKLTSDAIERGDWKTTLATRLTPRAGGA